MAGPTTVMDPVTHIVKRYAGTRLYDATALAYVTPDSLRAAPWKMVITEADTGEDITQQILFGTRHD
jgi:polyhydroxyalkanoate synthesis regulator protein